MSTRTHTIVGMTCEHCVRSVEEQIGKIGGVNAITVDLEGGLVTVESSADIADSQIVAAVDGAGYEVTPVTTRGYTASKDQLLGRTLSR